MGFYPCLKLFQEGYLSLFGEALLNEVLLKQQLQKVKDSVN
jgi:hypothetical protein|tara:strand:+ start:741 stop:863 length:123 start_codon:yes stop_codon:yes gene_type:complete